MSTVVESKKTFIAGEWSDSASGATMEVLNPSTGETIAEVPACTAADVDRAVEAAKQAAPEWLDATPRERSELLLRLADILEANKDELGRLESQNVGKPLQGAIEEMEFSADNLRYFAGAGSRSASSPASAPGTTR